MNSLIPASAPTACSNVCSPSSTAAVLNQECYCVAVSPSALHEELEVLLAAHGLPSKLADTHPHLFSALPVYVSRRHIEQVTSIVGAIEEVAALTAYKSAVLSWAPEIATFDPGSPGGLLGLDFHLGPDGPRLIEINTNPGGVLLNALLGQAQSACMADLTVAPTDATRIEQAVMHAMLFEWGQQRDVRRSGLIAIVDESPKQQFLYPEFLLYQELFQRNGYRSEICAPEALLLNQDRLWLGEEPVDLLYNRLTDFSLRETTHAAIRSAYLAGGVALSPHPRAHALYADKRNLAVLGDLEFLRASGASRATIDVLAAAVPRTQLVTTENREAMWAHRGKLFFKPAAGFGSKASYRGDKLTRRVWGQIATGDYVAQDIVAPSERHLAKGADPLKVDIRCYAYRGEALLFAARMYQGQTTNFRTKGGGFAPVLMEGTAAGG
jgi:hypothetical protein